MIGVFYLTLHTGDKDKRPSLTYFTQLKRNFKNILRDHLGNPGRLNRSPWKFNV